MKLSYQFVAVTCITALSWFLTEAQLRSGRRELKLISKDRYLADLEFRGSDPSFQLSQCEGDCDEDNDCMAGLVCYEKDEGGSGEVPGCSGTDTTRNDYCIDPADVGLPPTGPPPSAPAPTQNAPPPTGNPSTTSTALFFYGSDPPSSVLPLGVCEGDCDNDSDCASGLRCFQRNENAGPVPGCNGDDSSRTDYCISTNGPAPSPPMPSPTATSSSNDLENFKLKLYWQQGYFWQEETFERKWCMRCRGGSCSLGEKLYIEECDDNGVERFDFVYIDSDEILIRLHRTNTCLERNGRDIFIRNCDSGKSLQRWWAKRGDFDQGRFEISQLSATNLCITQRHHPKSDEEVELEPCTQARVGETSYWERCYTNSC